jgi:hypothetical protein
MAALTAEELVPGVVVQLDMELLRERGNSVTNAESGIAFDRAVVGPHSFLIVSVDASLSTLTAVPLFSKWAPGSEELDEGLKGGHQDKWTGAPLCFSRWQHWVVPVSDVVAASYIEATAIGDRRHYAQGKATALASILGWKDRNRCEFRLLRSPR